MLPTLRLTTTALVVGMLFMYCIPGEAGAPADLATVAPVGDLAAEAGAKVEMLQDYLKDESSYAEAKKRNVPQAAGVLACLGQAIAEHPAADEVQISGADLRDAALALRKAASYEDAASALAAAKSALAGEATGSAEADHAWNKLIGMHAMMEEINARNSKIRRAVRRLRDPETDSLHATTMAVLALAMYADTHEVKNENDIPQWQQHAREFRENMTATAEAMKNKDADGAREVWLKGVKSCSACHDQFRHEE